MAAKLQCEICGGKLMGKPGGIFECESCGTEYSTEWAKAKIQEIKGTVKVEGTVEVKGSVQVEGTANAQSLIKRGNLALEDGKWNDAKKYFDDALNAEPENAEAYLGNLMAELKVHSREKLAEQRWTFEDKNNFIKAIRFGDENLKAELNGYIELISERNNNERYTYACKLQASGEEKEIKQAASVFKELEEYKDSTERAEKCIRDYEEKRAKREESESASKYSAACDLQKTGEERDLAEAAKLFKALNDYKDSAERAEKCMSDYLVLSMPRLASVRQKSTNFKNLVAAAYSHTVGLKVNNTVVATQYVAKDYKGQCDVIGWKDIVAVSAGKYHTVGLRRNGTVVATEYKGLKKDYKGQCNVGNWNNIIAVSACENSTAGLKSDGTVVTVGTVYGVGSWSNIKAIAVGESQIVGLKSDGTVVTAGYHKVDVPEWKDIVKIAAGYHHIVGLKSDGTVVAAGANSYHQCDVSDWEDIVDISAGDRQTVGLKSDGTVIATECKNYYNEHIKRYISYDGQRYVADWNNIVAVFAGYDYIVGIKSDGTVVATGSSFGGKCKVQGWKLFKSETELNSEKTALQTELTNLKGVFAGLRRKQIEARLAQIDNELIKYKGE